MEKYFQPEIETMDRESLRALQLTKLKKSLSRCYENVPHFKNKFDEIGFKPEDLTCLEDLAKLPFLRGIARAVMLYLAHRSR